MSFSCRVVFRQALVLLLLAVPAAVLTAVFHPRVPDWGEPELGPGEIDLRTALGWEDALWVDARSRAEFEEAHVPGAVLLNEEEWDALFGEFAFHLLPDQKVVVYCGSSQCHASHHLAERLRIALGEGGNEVYVLKGGWRTWLEAQ